jgi:ribosome maturation factor RimP
MEREVVINEIRGVIEEYLQKGGFELIELIYRFEGRDIVLRILADRPEGGITLDECARLNKEMGFMLDERDIIKEKYTLEVSSPGLDRPLKTRNDFQRCLHRKIKFFLSEKVNGKAEWDGVVEKVEGDALHVNVEGAILKIPIAHIIKAKQILAAV